MKRDDEEEGDAATENELADVPARDIQIGLYIFDHLHGDDDHHHHCVNDLKALTSRSSA